MGGGDGIADRESLGKGTLWAACLEARSWVLRPDGWRVADWVLFVCLFGLGMELCCAVGRSREGMRGERKQGGGGGVTMERRGGCCLIYDSSFPAMYGHLDLPNPFHGTYAFLYPRHQTPKTLIPIKNKTPAFPAVPSQPAYVA